MAVVFDHEVMVCLCVIWGEFGGLLTVVSSKRGLLTTFSRTMRPEGLGREASKGGRKRHLLEKSLGLRQNDRIRETGWGSSWVWTLATDGLV